MRPLPVRHDSSVKCLGSCFDQPGRNPANHGARCDVCDDHCPRRHHRTFADSDAARNDRPCPDPDLVLHNNRPDEIVPAPARFVNQAMANGFEADIRADLNVAPNGHWFAGYTEAHIRIDEATDTDADIARAADGANRQRPPDQALALDPHPSRCAKISPQTVGNTKPWQVIGKCQEDHFAHVISLKHLGGQGCHIEAWPDLSHWTS